MKNRFKDFPQLRVRTEFTFRQTFAPLTKIIGRISEIGSMGAAIVDGGTWGHVRFAKAADKAGFKPFFGTEMEIATDDGRKPTAWVLAEDIKAFYRFSSACRRSNFEAKAMFSCGAKGVIRFAGSALDDPELFDYIDLNPGSIYDQRRSLALSLRTGKPLVITGDNWYASPEDRMTFMAITGNERVTPQHITSIEELLKLFPVLSEQQLERAIMNCYEVAERCATKLPTAPIINVEGDLRQLAEEGKARRLAKGQLKSWPQEYEDRLQRELSMVESKRYESYFIVVADLIAWAKQRMLVGPGRGSSAGSLLCYVLGITEVDPIPFNLLFERFIDINRNDLPDIDIDFSDAKREQVFEYLISKYKPECVARIGNVNTLKPRSAMAEVCKRMAVPDSYRFDVANAIVEYSSGDARFGHALEDTMTLTEAGRIFSEKFPAAAAAVSQTEGHAWHTGVHAAGVIVCNVPVIDYCTVGADGVAQIDKKDAEALNLLKIDALGLRTLGIIEDAGITNFDQLYSLDLKDPEVFKIFNEEKFTGIFQFEGDSQKVVARQVEIKEFQDIDHITALARPGPLGGGAFRDYIERKSGKKEVEYRHPLLEPILKDTYGVVLYQEQVMMVSRDIGKFSWELVSEIRKAMSGSKGKEYFDGKGKDFIAGAAQDGISEKEASDIWEAICTFGAWGMNKSHTCAYATISYWCAWMKRYHPLEYAAACLRHAKDDDHTTTILREMEEEGISYLPFDLERSKEHWSVSEDGILVGGFRNLVGFGPAKSSEAVRARDANRITPKMLERIQKAEVKFKSLRPIQDEFGDLIRNPQSYGCRAGSVVTFLNQLPNEGEVLVVVRVIKKELKDHNEATRVKKRNGRILRGPTMFVDVTGIDDTGRPFLFRIDRDMYESVGRRAFNNLQPNKDVLLIRGNRLPGFSMIKVDRVKCLTNPGALYEIA